MAKPEDEQRLNDVVETDRPDEAPMAEDVPDPFEELEALRAERDLLQDKFMRALADAENTRKRAVRDRAEAENYGGSRLARDMLPVFDNLKRAVDAVIEGIELTMRELLNVFQKHGIRMINPQIGDIFDPQQHEAMFEAPVPGTRQGEIIQVSAQGFMLRDRILRPAQVGVSSNKE